MEPTLAIAALACALALFALWRARGASSRGAGRAPTSPAERDAAAEQERPLALRDVLDRLDIVESKIGSLAREQIAFIEEADVILASVERKRKQRASVEARNLGGQADLPIEASEPRPASREEQKAAVRERMGKTTH